MTWLVFAVSLLLVLVGAIAVISGAPVIQIERGWAEVIAGSVSISGGAITFALAVVLMRLEALQQSVQRTAASAYVPEIVAVPAPIAIEAELRPTRAPEEPVYVAEPAIETVQAEPALELPAGEPSEERGSLWKPIAETSPDRPREQDRETPALLVDASIEKDAEAAGQGPAAENTEEQPVTAIPGDDAEAPRRLLAPSSELPPPDAGRPTRAASFARDWMSRPLLRSRSPKAPGPEAPPPLFDTSAQPDIDGVAPPVTAIAHLDENVAAPRVDVRAEPEPSAPLVVAEAEVLDDVTIIGRYQAGASAYTMYSDGSIDVETEGGDVHRFESMDALKAFIAHQESAVP